MVRLHTSVNPTTAVSFNEECIVVAFFLTKFQLHHLCRQLQSHYYGSKTYALLGWSMFAIGNITRFLSMRFAAQTILSGLGSIQFIIIPIASRTLLGTQTHSSTLVGIAVVLFGNAIILIYGPPDTTVSLHELRHRWTTPPMQCFLFILASFLLIFHVAWRVIHKHRRLIEAEQRATHVMERKFGDPSAVRTFMAALLFSVVSSSIGAWSVLFSKSLAYILSSTSLFIWDWYSWFTAVSLIVTAVYWIQQSNKGLRLYPAPMILPLMQAFWMTMSILEGMIYFDEARTLTSRDVCILGVGLVLAVIGAVAMGLTEYLNDHDEPSAPLKTKAVHDMSSAFIKGRSQNDWDTSRKRNEEKEKNYIPLYHKHKNSTA